MYIRTTCSITCQYKIQPKALYTLNLMFVELMEPTIRENEIPVPAMSWWWNKIRVQGPQGEVYYFDRSTEKKFLGEELYLYAQNRAHFHL